MRGGGGAIDFVFHARGGSAAEAIRWLAGKPLPVTCETPAAPGAAEPFVPPPPCERHWPQVRRWLTAERSLNAELVDSLRQDGKLYADGRRNAVFPCTDASGTVTGAECVGTRRRADGRRFRGMARGSRKAAGGFWTGKTGAAAASVVFLAESAIDALSALSMDSGAPAAIYASTAGVCQNLPDWLEAFGPTAVKCGFDADDAGDAAARALMAADPRVSRTRPEGAADWNEILNRHPRQGRPRRHGTPSPAQAGRKSNSPGKTLDRGSRLPPEQISGTGSRNRQDHHARIALPTASRQKK